jgi:hypothetical protein
MKALDRKLFEVETECRTEEITSELSRCSQNFQYCQYGLSAGKSSTYCLHPEHLKYRMTTNLSS